MASLPESGGAPSALAQIADQQQRWLATDVQSGLAKLPLRRPAFQTDSGVPIPDLLTPADRPQDNYLEEIGFPGRFPYTRGPQATMYRGRLWTMRQFAGFGTPED